MRARARIPSSGLIVLTDERQPPLEEWVPKLPNGSWVIFRNYYASRPSAVAKRLRLAERTAQCIRDHEEKDLKFLVAADHSLAVAVGADGLHLPQALMRSVIQHREDNPEFLFSTSCHDLRALSRAHQLRVDAALASPIFPTR